ncbi:MAG: DUF2335 domain-containing protein [Anaerolineae bacterium]|jgi:uncharacterized membrane protein|nr:DUF2335 domain-containing protein [Anaerolineae bacterium]
MTDEKAVSPESKKPADVLSGESSTVETGMSLTEPLSKILDAVVEKLPEEDRNAAKTILQVSMQSYSGPLPHPAILQGYEDVLKGSADRILKMAEAEQHQRHQNEAALIHAEVFATRYDKYLEAAGLGAATFIAALAVVSGALLLASGRDAAGLALILTPAAGIASVFFYAQRKRNQNAAPPKPPDNASAAG